MKRMNKLIFVVAAVAILLLAGSDTNAAERNSTVDRTKTDKTSVTDAPVAKTATVDNNQPKQSEPEQPRKKAGSAIQQPVTPQKNRDIQFEFPEVFSPVVPAPNEEIGDRGAQNINMDWYSINNGGEIEVSGSNFKLGITIGQPVAGEVVGTNYRMGFGFWYGASAGSGGGCNCPSQGDVAPLASEGDGIINLLDIVAMIDYVYRSGPTLPTDEPDCPNERGDIAPAATCGDGLVNLLDIVFAIDYVYRSGDPVCDPCTL